MLLGDGDVAHAIAPHSANLSFHACAVVVAHAILSGGNMSFSVDLTLFHLSSWSLLAQKVMQDFFP